MRVEKITHLERLQTLKELTESPEDRVANGVVREIAASGNIFQPSIDVPLVKGRYPDQDNPPPPDEYKPVHNVA